MLVTLNRSTNIKGSGSQHMSFPNLARCDYNYVYKLWLECSITQTPLNPFTPKTDQVQISPAASPEILHHTVWRTWVFIASLRWKLIILPIIATPLVHFSLKGWENVLFELGSERVNNKMLNSQKRSHTITYECLKCIYQHRIWPWFWGNLIELVKYAHICLLNWSEVRPIFIKQNDNEKGTSKGDYKDTTGQRYPGPLTRL